jgi:hypothetical protein
MLRIVIPVLGRPSAFATSLPEIIRLIGVKAEVVVVVDGDPTIDWHAVHINELTAHSNGATVIVVGSHQGNGTAFERGCTESTDAICKVDADVIPSEAYGLELLNLARKAPPNVGCIIGLPRSTINRHNVGLRPILHTRAASLRIALFRPNAVAALQDQHTVHPLGQHDLLVAARLDQAGLRRVYTHRVWVEEHVKDESPEYEEWATPYREIRHSLPVKPGKTFSKLTFLGI